MTDPALTEITAQAHSRLAKAMTQLSPRDQAIVGLALVGATGDLAERTRLIGVLFSREATPMSARIEQYILRQLGHNSLADVVLPASGYHWRNQGGGGNAWETGTLEDARAHARTTKREVTVYLHEQVVAVFSGAVDGETRGDHE